LLISEALDFIQTREFRGRIPGHVVEHMVGMSELAVKTALLDCQDKAEDDLEDSPEPVINQVIRFLSILTPGQGLELQERAKKEHQHLLI
jgi:hypothetical protein